MAWDKSGGWQKVTKGQWQDTRGGQPLAAVDGRWQWLGVATVVKGRRMRAVDSQRRPAKGTDEKVKKNGAVKQGARGGQPVAKWQTAIA